MGNWDHSYDCNFVNYSKYTEPFQNNLKSLLNWIRNMQLYEVSLCKKWELDQSQNSRTKNSGVVKVQVKFVH